MQVANEVSFAITRYSVTQDEVMHPATDVDRVKLDKNRDAQELRRCCPLVYPTGARGVGGGAHPKLKAEALQARLEA